MDDYMDYYNNSRCQWGLKQKTPKEYREYLLGLPSMELTVVSGKNSLPGLVQEGNPKKS